MPQQYGAYALAFEILLFMSVVYASLILEPMTVFGPSIFKDDFRAYLGILLRIHCALSLLMIVAVSPGRSPNALKPTSSLPAALVGVAVASPCLLLFWLVRRGFYVHLVPKKAAVGACVYSAVVLAGVTAVYKLHSLSSLLAFLIMAAAGAPTTGPAMLRWFKSHMPLSPGLAHSG